MFYKKYIWAALLVMAPASNVWADSTADFQQILKDHWARASAEKVFYRTDPDTFRMNGSLPEFNKKARDRRAAFNEAILKRLEGVDETELNQADRVSFKLFRYERESEAKTAAQASYLFPITKLFGYHTYFADAPANMSFLKNRDYENYLVSLADFPRYNREQMDLLREAIEKGYTHYCAAMTGYEDTIRQHIVDNAEDSKLFGPFKSFPAQMPAEKQAELRRKGLKLVREKVIPEFQAFYDFYTKDYMANCRKDVAISALEGGAQYYQSEIEYYTTTSMNAEEIHALGLSEVKRIRAEMKTIMKKVGFEGGFKAFLDYLRNEPKFYAKSELELLGRTALIAKDVEGALPKYFGRLPRGTYKIRPGARGAYYMASTGDGTTSGTFFIGTRNLMDQPFYTLEALTFHEGVPGHHLQSALALELDIPEFRRTLYHAAYGEGWGLYSEFLGKEMGFYQDPYAEFGKLTFETWRAVRLVVDTGLHALGWSREKAIQYMLDNTALSHGSVEAQIDRYITWPAQALSYKIGEIKIQNLRKKAERALGEKFDLRAFHDILLGNGSLPIAILEELVGEWIIKQQ